MKCAALCLITALLCSLPPVSYANSVEPIRVAVPDISSLLTENQDGVYQRIMRRALQALDTEIQESFYPYKRTMLAFKYGEADCVYSFTEVLEGQLGEEAIIASFPLGKFSYYLFALKGKALPLSLAGLEGQQVGAVMGHETYLDTVLDGHDIDVNWSRNDALNVAMLEHGRFDYMIAAIPDIRPHLDKLSYAPEQPLLESFDRLTCHNTERNRAFLQALSGELRRLKGAGDYQEIAGPLYLDFDSNAVMGKR
ncbi:hypothetical protein BKP64_15765 [Marinobacter salinus]|uniref:Solute-binding protein family 3/N-terminal domain-containing protein n=1 Tax=Marinobacter salinus TaxID=1874317 RepID=A0A1D9GPF1_9GAMM|nr:hypothetical protein [Marinobacter salinus]AOY89508.1 hypothetical protein BKP64_15765 [Marinobacter salinus]